jgi:uncharacterized protein (DUF1499 family)
MEAPERTGPNSARASRTYNLPPEEVLAAAERAVTRLPRWRVESSDGRSLKAVRTTRVFRFRDDVELRAKSEAGGTRLELNSASRVGRNDLGQNRRNLAELLAALDREVL